MTETFDTAEAAEYLKCHVETVRELIRRKEIAASKVGRRFVIRRTVLDAFLAEKENDAVQASPAPCRSKKICLNIKVAKQPEASTVEAVSGTWTSGQKAAAELDALLALKTTKKPKGCSIV